MRQKVKVKEIDGVPLTPEILEACGFVKSNTDYGIKAGTYDLDALTEFADVNNSFTYFINQKKLSFGYYCNINVSYLHQLQNLFFALTGQELEVKLPELKTA